MGWRGLENCGPEELLQAGMRQDIEGTVQKGNKGPDMIHTPPHTYKPLPGPYTT